MKKNVLIFASTLLLFGCASNETADSSSVKQTEIYQDYSVTWDGDSKELDVYATYRFGGENGTTLRLSPPSSITLNGEKMNQSKLLFGGASYHNNTKTWSDNYAFVFTDTENKSYKNNIGFRGVEFAENVRNPSKTAVLEIAVTRDIMTSDEIFLNVADTSINNKKLIKLSTDDPASMVKYDAATKKIQIEPAFFADMADVELRLWMSYDKSADLTAATALGGDISISYTSRKQLFTRKD